MNIMTIIIIIVHIIFVILLLHRTRSRRAPSKRSAVQIARPAFSQLPVGMPLTTVPNFATLPESSWGGKQRKQARESQKG